MKKLLITLIVTIFSCLTFAQGIEIKGRVIEINECRLLDEGEYKITRSNWVSGVFITLNDSKFSIRGTMGGGFKLTDKKVDTIGGDLIVSYMTTVRRDTPATLAARECNGKLLVAIFPMDGSDKFIEYIINYTR